MLEATDELTVPPPAPRAPDSRRITKKRRFADDRYSQSGAALFWPDLHRLCLRQIEKPAGDRLGLDELLSALRVAARPAVRHHVEDAVRRTQQSAIFDRNHTRHRQRIRSGHDCRATVRTAVVP